MSKIQKHNLKNRSKQSCENENELEYYQSQQSEKVKQLKSLIDKQYPNNGNSLSIENITNIEKDPSNNISIKDIKIAIKNYFEKQSRSNNLDCVYPNTEDIEEYRVSSNCPIVGLRGESGVRGKKEIPRVIILDRYIGNEMLEEEFDDTKAQNSLDYYRRNKYLFGASFHAPNTNDSVSEPKQKRRRLNSGALAGLQKQKQIEKRNEKIAQLMNKCKKIIIEPNQNNRCLCSLINDCRQNIYTKEKTPQDKMRQNVEFIQATVNSWPMIFVLTLRPIRKWEQLFADYGDAYYSVVLEYEYRQKLVELVKVCNGIEQIEKLRSQDPDV